MKDRIYLIGLAGSGKTKIGELLANQIGYKFIDMNTEIEKEAVMFLDEIIHHYTYETVTVTEQKLLERFKELSKVVIACNDAVVTKRENKKLLDGTVLYLDVDVKKLEKRLENEYPKKAFEEITVEELSKKRYLIYRDFSSHIIDNNSDDPYKTIENILDIL